MINLGLNAGITTMIYAVLQAGHSEATIGWMMAASGAAMLVGALLAPALVPRIGAGMLMILGLIACTAAVAGGVFVESPWGVALLISGAVFLIPALNAAFSGYLMVATPTELIGRVNSVGGVLSMGAMPLSPLIAGFGLAWAGRSSTLTFSLALCAIALVMGLPSGPCARSPPRPHGRSTRSSTPRRILLFECHMVASTTTRRPSDTRTRTGSARAGPSTRQT